MINIQGGKLTMTIRMTGYDITEVNADREGSQLRFHGTAHLEMGNEPVDMPFVGTKVKGQMGFNDFFFKDPDETRWKQLAEQAGDIRDMLMETVLAQGVETGEFEAHQTLD
jgi:hypothetical protein